MAHMGVIDITPNEPAHCAARDNVRSEVFLGSDSRRTHDSGQAVCSYTDDSLVLEFMIEQRGYRPYLYGMTGRE